MESNRLRTHASRISCAHQKPICTRAHSYAPANPTCHKACFLLLPTLLPTRSQAVNSFCGWDVRMPGNQKKMSDFEAVTAKLLASSSPGQSPRASPRRPPPQSHSCIPTQSIPLPFSPLMTIPSYSLSSHPNSSCSISMLIPISIPKPAPYSSPFPHLSPAPSESHLILLPIPAPPHHNPPNLILLPFPTVSRPFLIAGAPATVNLHACTHYRGGTGEVLTFVNVGQVLHCHVTTAQTLLLHAVIACMRSASVCPRTTLPDRRAASPPHRSTAPLPQRPTTTRPQHRAAAPPQPRTAAPPQHRTAAPPQHRTAAPPQHRAAAPS